MPSRLSATQIQSYNDNGYLIWRDPVFAPERFDQLRAFAETCYEEAQPGPTGKPAQLIDCPHWGHPEAFEWIFSDAMLDLVEPLIGPDIAVFASHFLRKEPGTGRRVPWHEDSHYWRELLNPMEVATLMVAIEASTTENGCMRVVQGSHAGGYSEYDPIEDSDDAIFHFEIKPDQIDEDKVVDLAYEPNQASLHHVKIMHSSNPNTSDRTRLAFTVRYFPTHVRFTNTLDDDFFIFLARGKDQAGNTYSDPTIAHADHSRKAS